MRSITLCALVLLALAAPALAGERCRVYDGDTIICRDAGRVRLLGIDAPELRSAKCPEEKRLAEQARDRLQSLVEGKDVTLRPEGRDKYRRLLASAEAGGEDVGSVLLREGHARVWTGRLLPWCP